jgi:hypothetical protein
MSTLRRRLARSPLLTGALARLIAGYLRLCRASSRWQVDGTEDLRAALAEGPVIVLIWHECTLMAPLDWARIGAPLSSLRDTSPVGQVSGAVQARFGLSPAAMAGGASNRAASRDILRRFGRGVSIGLTGDGPTGPARVLKPAALDWARVTGAPVFLYAFAARRHRRLSTWDRMILPLPFTTGLSAYRRWPGALPRHATPAGQAALTLDLAAALTALTDQVAAKVRQGP